MYKKLEDLKYYEKLIAFHQKNIKESQDTITEYIRLKTELESQFTYCEGQCFRLSEEGTFILARVDENQVGLICISVGPNCGIYWDKPIKVKNTRKITPEEFRKITGYMDKLFSLLD